MIVCEVTPYGSEPLDPEQDAYEFTHAGEYGKGAVVSPLLPHVYRHILMCHKLKSAA
jgi:hypothetical protein